MKQTAWFLRKFPLIEDNGLLPDIIERLSGTPARLDERLRQIPPNLLIQKEESSWSIKEHAGHLSDLEPLWYGRLEDLIVGLPELRVTDITNQLTHHAGHDHTPTEVLLQRFRDLRQRFVRRLQTLTGDQMANSALHPRLKTPMRIIDLAWFVAEHDDHHLASIREISG